MTAYEYRIEYQVQRRDMNSDEDFIEIGFGSSCAQDSVNDAAYAIESYVQNRAWETDGDMPDPDEVDR